MLLEIPGKNYLFQKYGGSRVLYMAYKTKNDDTSPGHHFIEATVLDHPMV